MLKISQTPNPQLPEQWGLIMLETAFSVAQVNNQKTPLSTGRI